MAIFNCTLDRNILRSTTCGYSLPKITDIYLVNYDDVASSELGETSGGCEEITAITLVTGATWFHIEPAKDSTSFSDELAIGDAGNKYRTHSITFTISAKYDGCLHLDNDALSLGRYLVVVKNAEGTYLALGRLTGLEASEGSYAGGTDTNGLTFTLSADVAESSIPLSEGAVTALLNNVASND